MFIAIVVYTYLMKHDQSVLKEGEYEQITLFDSKHPCPTEMAK
ncbi:hypothetical protein B4114_1207 [Geobacillus stearothermophilus]|uniref:Uncharacterized protein n=1 Tax=Geobacillus stearothermophilus TaxID=1422 RepID=A0A150NF53_GEOSE|nr:hypothetical protein B4114_1207 [Geobacillus stearothermophilus]